MKEYPNWFIRSAKDFFERNLPTEAGKPNLKYLQVGVFTGDTSVWLLNNILTDSSSTLTDIDTWVGTTDEPMHALFDWSDVEKTYDEKLSTYQNVIKCKSSSIDFFNSTQNKFDFIYIDGDHQPSAVLVDANGAWNCLNANGIIAFDDYGWQPKAIDFGYNQVPKPGIDEFLANHEGEYEIIDSGFQIWIKKL